MNRNSCPQEAIVVQAARTGCWNDFTKTHINNCAYCREIAGIAEWMGNIARTDIQDFCLPESGQVFLNAHIAAAEEAREKALRPLRIAEFFVSIAVILVLAAGILGAWFGFRWLAANSLPSNPHLPQSLVISAAALATGLVAMLFTKLAQPVLTEE
jgi:hypothetical protein